MSLMDEFEVYDWTTADALEKGDLIFWDDQLIEVHTVEDNIGIDITGYSYQEDDVVSYTENKGLPFDYRVNLYKIKD